jgi:beta-glucanase (GH16 family)
MITLSFSSAYFMKSMGWCLLGLLWACPLALLAQDWQLVWSDEFDRDGLPDSSHWGYDLGDGCPNLCGWGNAEEQTYTDRPENVRVENGHLIVEAHRTPEGAFTSGRVVSRDKAAWCYGRVEVRAKLPSGQGTWSALWLMPTESVYGPWPRSGEIDLMEHVGYDPLWTLGTVHTRAYNGMYGTQIVDSTLVGDAEWAFHAYAIEWDEDAIDFLVDGQRFFTFNRLSDDPALWPFDQPFYFIANLAVGGHWGGKYGVDPTIWPRQLVIDYVRVYQDPESTTQ